MTTPADIPQYLDIRGYAELLGVPWTTVRDFVTARRLQITWVGRHARFSAQDIEANRQAWVRPSLRGTGPPSPAPSPTGPSGPPRPLRRVRPAA